MKYFKLFMISVLISAGAKAQFLEISYPYGLGDAEGVYKMAVGYESLPRIFGYEIKLNYGAIKIEEESAYNLYGTIGLSKILRTFNTLNPINRRLTIKAGYGELKGENLVTVNGAVAGVSYTHEVEYWDFPTISYSLAYEHHFYQSEELNPNINFILLGLAIHFF